MSVNLPLAKPTWGIMEKIAAHRVILSGRLTMGSHVSALEREFAAKIGSKWAIMVNSGSSANLLGVTALRLILEEDDFKYRNEVIVPTISWSTTYYPWHQLGFKLKFVDVSADTFNLDESLVESSIDENTVGICVVHLLGNPANMRVLKNIAESKNLFIFEDTCEAMGTRYEDKFVGTFGDFGTFSTYFSHHISTGEGGFLVTDNDKLAHYAISLRAHGWLRDLPETNHVANKTGDQWLDKFRFYLPGYNLRPMEVQAAPGRVQLRRLDSFNDLRRQNAEHYKQVIKEIPWLHLQNDLPGSTWFAFGHALRTDAPFKRKPLIDYLGKVNVETRPLVTGSFLRNKVIERLSCVDESKEFAVAEWLDTSGFMIGNHPFDIRREIDRLGKALANFA